MSWQIVVHLVVGQLVLDLSVLGLVLALVGLSRGVESLVRVALGFFVLAGLAALAAFMTGDPTYALVGEEFGLDPAAVGEHAGVGAVSLVAQGVLAAISVAGLRLARGLSEIDRKLTGFAMVLALVAIAVAAWTFVAGKAISHPEIRPLPAAEAPPLDTPAAEAPRPD